MSLYQYPLDLTGELSSNRVTIPVTIGSGKVDRAYAFPAGPFYTKDFRLYETGKQTTPLTRGTDYELIIGHAAYRRVTGNKEVCIGVLITNPKVGTDLINEANVVGGPESAMVAGYEEAIRNLNLDNRDILFKDLHELPDLFPAAPAYKDLGDIYGFEYIISVLGKLLNARGAADEMTLETLRAMMEDLKNAFMAALKVHVEAEGNVHNLTIEQLNGYSATKIDELLQAIRKSVDSLRQLVNDVIARMDVADKRMTAFENSLKAHGTALGTLREDYERLYVLIANLQRDMEEIIAKELAKIKDDLKRMQDEIDSLKNSNSNLQQQINNLLQEIEQLKIRVSNNETNISKVGQDLNAHIKADDPHTGYLHKKYGGVVQAKVHINAEFTTRDDMIAYDGTK